MVIAVTGLAMVGIALSGTVGIKTARIARDRQQARLLLNQKMEDIRRVRDDDVANFFSLGTRTEEETLYGDIKYTLITQYTEEIPGERMRVEAEVSWQDGQNVYSLDQSTYLDLWK